jgi:hypothetical protein
MTPASLRALSPPRRCWDSADAGGAVRRYQALPLTEAISAADLRCEYRSEPLRIDAERPRLSWVLSTDAAARSRPPIGCLNVFARAWQPSGRSLGQRPGRAAENCHRRQRRPPQRPGSPRLGPGGRPSDWSANGG